MKYELRFVGMRINIITLFVILFVSIVWFATRTTAQEQNQQAYDVACEATDAATMKECITKAKNKEYDLIRIMNVINCTSKEDCAFDLSNVEKAIKIYGITNTDTGFRRTGDFGYSLFTIKNSKDIVIGSFLIDDTSEGNCAPSCPPLIAIENAANTTIDQLRTKSAKNTAVSVIASMSITVKNSEFSDSASSALVFSADGTNVIEGNTFAHNHRAPLYEGCVGICSGAQVSILPNTKNVTIAKNTIKDGSIDAYTPFGLYASGIEIAPVQVENVIISCNKIYGNSGNGFVISNRTSSTRRIIMKQNAIYTNGINVNFYLGSQDQIENNCFDASCKISGC